MDFTDLSVNLRTRFTTLFTPQNYCFATADPGRSPTFYFAQGGLNALNNATLCGRIRTYHRSGPLIDITTSAKGHIFFSTLQARNIAYNAVRGVGRAQRRGVMNGIEQNNRTAPQANDFHLEYTRPAGNPNGVSRLHPSGGRIVLMPRITGTQIQNLINRLLADGCQIQLNRAVQHALQPTPTRRPVPGVQQYLASL